MADDVETQERPSWQRPPFEPGNLAALRHGSYSERRIAPLAAANLAAVVEVDPELGSPRWRAAALAWARSEAIVALLTAYIEERGEKSRDGVGDLGDARVLAAWNLLHRAEARSHALRGRLGLDPLSAARLGRDRAAASVDMAQLMKALADRDRADSQDASNEPDPADDRTHGDARPDRSAALLAAAEGIGGDDLDDDLDDGGEVGES